MSHSPIKVDIDNSYIQRIIEQRISEHLITSIHWVDIDRLEKMTSMKYRFLHDNFLQHPSVKCHERTKARKKYYRYPEVIEAINSLIEKW